MIIIVDGYNLLKQLYPNSKENLDLIKKNLITKLSFYKKTKKGAVKEIIVVYDGGGLIHATREVRQEIVILEAGYKRSADDWIIEYTDRYKTNDITIVSMDRALCFTCEQHGAFSIGVFDFMQAVDQIITNSLPQTNASLLEGSINKYSEANIETDIEMLQTNDNIDSLMNEGALMRSPKKQDFVIENRPKQAAPLSKKEKTLLKKLKKIY